MKQWNNLSVFRQDVAKFSLYEQKDLLFSCDFKLPLEPKSTIIVVGGSDSILYAVQKVARILELHSGATVYIILETDKYADELSKLATGSDSNNNEVIVMELAFPLSPPITAALASGRLPAKVDCSIMIVPYNSYDEMKYVSSLPLGELLSGISKETFVLNNANYLTTFNHPLNDIRHVGGLSFSAYASLSDNDVELLFKYAKAASGGVAVEVGRYLGGSTTIIALSLQQDGKPISFFSFDPLLPEITNRTFTKNSVQQDVNVFQMFSADAFQNWGQIGDGKQIDFLFIDADHSYEGLKFDLESWATLVKKGGVMMLHDYANVLYSGIAGVDVAIHEMMQKGGWEIVESCAVSLVCRRV